MKKTWNMIRTVLTWLLVTVAVLTMVFTVVSVNTFDRNDRSIFGYKVYIVLSDSMSAVKDDPSHGGYFDAGDLVLIKEVDPSTLQAGDIIAYTSTNAENFGETVTHMIRSKTTDANGDAGFVTYGTTTGTDDKNVVLYDLVQGKYAGRVPAAGKFFEFLKTTPGYIICILLPFLLLIGVQGFHSIRLFQRHKAEQLAEMEEQREKDRAELAAERAAIAEERKKQEEIMQKLMEMQAAMQQNEAANEGSEETDPAENAPAEDDSSDL